MSVTLRAVYAIRGGQCGQEKGNVGLMAFKTFILRRKNCTFIRSHTVLLTPVNRVRECLINTP